MEQKDALGNKVKVGVIGVVNNEELGQPRLITYSSGRRGAAAVEETGHVIQRTGQFLQRFVVGREDKCQLGGPVKIADMAGKAAKLGFEWLVQLVALLSVGIGFLNLLPIPPLDGGHLLFYGVEAVIRPPGVRTDDGNGLSGRACFWCWASWGSCSGTICLGAEIMKKFGFGMVGVETPFTMHGDMSDAKATPRVK